MYQPKVWGYTNQNESYSSSDNESNRLEKLDLDHRFLQIVDLVSEDENKSECVANNECCDASN